MGKVTFFLSMPRCRTAWLATYLTGMGVYCFHELWRKHTTIESFKNAITAFGPLPVANADPSNWFYVHELQEAFPGAQFIEISRSWSDVDISSQRAYGAGDLSDLYRAYAYAQNAAPERHHIAFEKWGSTESIKIWNWCREEYMPFNWDWHDRLHELQIQVTEQRRHLDTQGYPHILNKIREHVGGAIWEQQ